MIETRVLAKDCPRKINQQVEVAGWVSSRRDHGGVIFIDLRDHSGIIQLTINPKADNAFKLAETLRDEFVIFAAGTVLKRDANLTNENIETGSIEIKVDEIKILNKSKALPFPIQHQGEINEELRLKYRFLDLRRQKMQKRLKRIHQFNSQIRKYMSDEGFTEVTTPILTSSSPEGARDFLVPSRLHAGKFYALPQAPQQFKQLLMVGGLEKYFQIAPCFRDEDPRADRHPGEFYQLDLEMSFVDNGEQVRSTIEPLIKSLVTDFGGLTLKSEEIPRIAYAEAIDKYGSDKPDLRFGMEMINLTSYFENTNFSVFASSINNSGVIKAICCTGGNKFSRSQIDHLTEVAKREGAGGLAYIQIAEGLQDGFEQKFGLNIKSPILKFLSDEEIENLLRETKAQPGDIIFFGADDKNIVNKSLGKVRLEAADILNLKDPKKVAIAWIVDFPMYEFSEIERKLDFSHNPFSMPKGGLEALNNKDPLDVMADQYDMVANGYEICSGAIRNHNPEIMYQAFAKVGLGKDIVDEKFGAMIRAFEFGAPPHGGCAFGLERLFMILEDEPNIREVIAFPKNGSALDLMMNAPSSVEEKQLKDLHIKTEIKK